MRRAVQDPAAGPIDRTDGAPDEPEIAMRRDAGRLALLLEASNDGHWDHDLPSGEVWRSPRLVALIGPSTEPTDLPHLAFGDTVHPEDRDMVAAAFAVNTDACRTIEVEFRLRMCWGGYRWFRARAGARFDAAGRPCRIAGTLTDVNDIRRTLRDLEDRSRGLERTRDQAERASRVKSDFLATVSHEIRTPLNGMLGMASLLRTTALSAEQRRYVDVLASSGKTLLSLIDGILDFSRLEAGQVQIDIVEFALAPLIAGVIDVVTPAAREKDLDLSMSVDQAVAGTIMGDEGRLRQILTNLAGNAVKFTERGSVSIAATCAARAGHLCTVRFTVTDTGIGIARESQTRIFERFTQADSSTTRKYGGTGLGLAICRQLVDLMDGRIGLESAPGSGSTFWFEIPLVAARATPHGDPDAASAPSMSPSLHILLADDNALNREFMAGLLRKAGHRIDVVADGCAAVDAVRRAAYDVVLMDVQMPIMDGMEATRAIRRLGGAAGQVPIVALTANAMKGDRERYISAGMNDYVAKPVEVDALADALGRSTGMPVNVGGAAGGPPAVSPPDRDAEAAIAAFLARLDTLDGPDDA